MAHKVFICHASTDKAVADAACAALEAQRIPCWIAPRDILAGEEYGKSIVDALASCQIVLLVFSAHANGSPQVRREIERAVSKGKIIVPFRIEDVLPSDAMEFALSNTHWLDALTPPMESYLLQLCDTISRLIQKHTVAEAPLWKPQEAADEEAERKAREAEEARVREAEERRAREAREAEQARLRDAAESEAQKEEERKALEAKQANGGAKATAKPTVGSTPRVVAPRTAKAEIEEPKSGSHRLPGWAGGVLAVVFFVVVLALGWLFRFRLDSAPDTISYPAATPDSVLQGSRPAPVSSSNQPVQKPDFAAITQQADALYNQRRYGEAAPLYDQACVGGNAGACNRLGSMNESGEGVAKDPARAAGLYDQACEGGDINGCSNEEGHYSKACEGGDANGCSNIDRLLKQEFTIYSKACEGGDANGCSFLGDYYRAGIGVAKDPDKARQFLTKGCNMGDQVGCDWLKKMHWWHWW
jgi:hypothetical protein